MAVSTIYRPMKSYAQARTSAEARKMTENAFALVRRLQEPRPISNQSLENLGYFPPEQVAESAHKLDKMV